MKLFQKLVFCLFVLIFSPHTFSAPPKFPTNTEQEHRQNQKQEEELETLQPKVDLRNNTTPSPLTLPQNESPCYRIQHILLTDFVPQSPSSPSPFSWAVEKALQQLKLNLPYCLGKEGLGVLIKSIQNKILEKGYLTTRILVKEQDLQSGNLELSVLSGKIGNILLKDESLTPRLTRLTTLTGLAFHSGEVLNIRAIEQSLENLKRVPTADAQIEILPAENQKVEESDLKITYRQDFPFRLHFALDDSGSRFTGKYLTTAGFSADSLLSANDLFYASFTHSLKSKRDDKGSRASQYHVFYYSIPYGYWTFSLSHTNARYHQEIWGAFENTYLYSGKSQNTQFEADYLFYRDSSRKSKVSLGLWMRHSQNFIDHAEIEVQRRKMAGWNIHFTHWEYLKHATLEMDLGFKRGTGMGKSLPAPEEERGEGTAHPKIVSASFSVNAPFWIGKEAFQWQSVLRGQWNETPLIAQDRFSIGGRYTVRGFDGELMLSGNRGWLLRNDLSWNYATQHQFYVGVDWGGVSKTTEWELGQNLTGAVMGFRGNFKHLNYDFFIGKALEKPTAFKTTLPLLGLSVGMGF